MNEIQGNNALKGSEEKKPVMQILASSKNQPKASTTKPKKENSPKIEKLEEVKPVAKKEPTLQELKNRATVVYLLQEKHTKLIEKRASLDKFAIKHENENASITVRDANGEEFKSSSPKTINQFIEFCKAEFEVVINEVEKELMKAFAA
jgi:adenine C2-methylase RlmN of 23S rRNA A2503 and tRNA A37